MDSSARRRSGRPRRDGKKPDTRSLVLHAARLEFASRGFAGAGLETISEAVGIRRPSLLHHFPTKDALYAAVVRDSFSELARALTGAMSSAGDFPERLDALVDAFTNFLDGDPAVASIVLREFLDGAGPGRDILRREVCAVLDAVERFVDSEGAGSVKDGLAIRAAIVQIASDALMRAAAGDLRKPLWGRGDHARALARALILAP